VSDAQNLAAGLSDIVVLLERPRDRRYHKFDVSFENFVKSSKTLLAVDELIRFASKGARSIYTVTVLNAFSYQPEKKVSEEDNQQCHDALGQILKSKRPRVVLRCHREAYVNEWLKHIEQPGENYQLRRKEISVLTEPPGNYVVS
ncbi:hypothetical protein BO94DRAFT_468646, partial [Aspergillus sclerotioniger CBS 115572]